MGFARNVFEAAARRGLSPPPETHPEPLAGLDYSEELALKREAFAAFWTEAKLPGRPEPVLPAPQPRGYRTTTKRRVVPRARGIELAFPGAPAGRRLALSALDLPEHLAVYEWLLDRLTRPAARPLAAALNWTIVRGTAGRLALILNIRRMDARIVRAAKQLADALQESPAGVGAGFLYLDPSDSGYYLEARRPHGTLSFKRLFGPDWLQVEVRETRFRFPVTVFSQVNGAMLETMCTTALALLGPLAGRTLLDLYCGYGLFSLTASRQATRVTGVDADGPAIAAARANAAHHGVTNRTRFIAGRIDAALLETRLRPPSAPEAVLLDPPRQGTAPGVVAALAARQPADIVHICCGTEAIPRELAAWDAAGYAARRVIPLDLFAGTTNLETMLQLGRRARDPRR